MMPLILPYANARNERDHWDWDLFDFSAKNGATGGKRITQAERRKNERQLALWSSEPYRT